MSRDALFAQNINLKGKLKIPCPALMVSLLCFSWYLREVQNALCWVWWLWTGFWIQLHALKWHFQLQILFKSKTRVYWSTKAEFRFFLIDFVPFLMFHIGMCYVKVTKKQRDFGCVLNLFFFSWLKSFLKKSYYTSSSTGQHAWSLYGLSNITFYLQPIRVQPLVAIDSESCQTLFQSFVHHHLK